jgi:antitoxin (DNA-binding transcriptional repressor) of toxin-antitoxin stability system
MCHMKTATVRQIHNEFSKVLSWVRDGEEVVVECHRRAVARILPPARAAAPVLPDFMGRLKATFGAKVTPDSKALFDEMRGER